MGRATEVMDTADWDVRRIGGTVRVNLTRAGHLSAADADSILAATEQLLGDGEVSIVDVSGPFDAPSPPGGLARVLKGLHRLAEGWDSQLIVSSI
jgi:hypothetical protein